MKNIFNIFCIIVVQISYSQNKIFLNEEKEFVRSNISIQFQKPDTTLVFNNQEKYLFAKDSNQLIQLNCEGYNPTVISFSNFLLTDTIYFQFKTKSIEEFVVSSKAIRRESHDTLHIVDFHFVKGQLFSIRKSIRDIRRKYLCKDEECFEVNNSTQLIYNDLNNEQVVEIKDSIFLFDGNYLSFLEHKKTYYQKFSNFLGHHKNRYYYRGNFFYKLIDEYTCFNTDTEREIPTYITYDSTSMYFISQQYVKSIPQTTLTPPIFFRYKSGHRNQGEIFRNTEKIQISKPTIKTASTYKSLIGSPGLIQTLPILEKSRSEAYLLDSVLYVIDFNKSCLVAFSNGEYFSTLKLPLLENVWYRNQFSVDEKTKKCYFYVKEDNKHCFVELDLNNGAVRKVKSPDFYNSIYHWEVWDGRFYFLVSNDNKTEWQRVFYSYAIDDPRMN